MWGITIATIRMFGHTVIYMIAPRLVQKISTVFGQEDGVALIPHILVLLAVIPAHLVDVILVLLAVILILLAVIPVHPVTLILVHLVAFLAVHLPAITPVPFLDPVVPIHNIGTVAQQTSHDQFPRFARVSFSNPLPLILVSVTRSFPPQQPLHMLP